MNVLRRSCYIPEEQIHGQKMSQNFSLNNRMKIKLEDNGLAYSGLLNLKKITQPFGRKNTLPHKGRATKESHLFQITA
jgi:hypothetical protein